MNNNTKSRWKHRKDGLNKQQVKEQFRHMPRKSTKPKVGGTEPGKQKPRYQVVELT